MRTKQQIWNWEQQVRIFFLLMTSWLANSAHAQTVDSFNPGSGGVVFTTAVQGDGKILVGGAFTSFGGQSRSRIARLNFDGTLDMTFKPGTSDSVFALGVQADGKILVGGFFSTLGGEARTNIGRLHANGTIDTTFNAGANSQVTSVVTQPDGKILVAGFFSTLNGQTRNSIGRLNADGTLDAAFAPQVSGGSALILALQSDGKILVGGLFTKIHGQNRSNIGRLNADGTLDSSFDPGADNWVRTLAIEPDGRILLGGDFNTLAGQPRAFIGRLHADGSLDGTFNPGADGRVYSLSVQTDRKILLGGNFITLAGGTRSRIGRLTVDGALDNSFDTGANGIVYSLAMQRDGRVLAGGDFTTLGGQTRNRIGRLNTTELPMDNLAFDGSTIIWQRGGSSPEVARTTFEASTNGGTTWFEIGVGSRIPNGWQLTNVFLPSFSTIRARGFITGGYGNGSSWFAETNIGLPLIYIQPTRRTNNAATTATFTVVADGSALLNYQWQQDGSSLSDGGNISGAQSAMLTLTNVFGAEAGDYSVIISNSYGSVTSQVATLTVNEPIISGQPTNQLIVPGEIATFKVMTIGTPAMNYQWRKDGTNISGASESSLILTNVQLADEGNYNVVVSNAFGSATSAVAVLTVNSANPDSFNPGINSTYDPFLLSVNSMVIQTDGKILTGGNFTALGGQTRYHIGRLNMDGTLDTAFNPGVSPLLDSSVYSLAIQPDGKILVGGFFSFLGEQPRSNIGRLNSDGTLDASFNSQFTGHLVYSLATQPDGKILVGGRFTSLGGQTRTNIGRLNLDGTLDTAFNPGVNYDPASYVNSIVVQADGKILVGGSFTNLAGQSRRGIGRLNVDGSLDTTFNPGSSSANVHTLAVQPDGQILVGGAFTNLGGQTRFGIGRLNSDGSLDTSFNPGDTNNVVESFALQTDGKIVVGGIFSTLAGQPRSRIARLNADGTPDITFNPGANGEVRSLALQRDGKVLVGGKFSRLGGQTRNGIGRLNATDPATDDLTFNGSTITWLRGGSSPEVWRTTFAISTNGTTWTDIGSGTPIPGGWRLTNVFLPPFSTIRARGLVSAGFHNSSSWLVESGVGFPSISHQPVSRTNDAATTAHFNILALGTMLNYQWFKDGISLIDSENISGTQSAILTLSNVFGSDAGDYFAVISNNYGSVTSLVATFFVRDPVVSIQPTNQLINVGQTASLNATAFGTPTLNYQWRRNGTNLAEASASSLIVSEAGNYDVIVTNSFGSVTSSVAVLNVNLADADSFNPESDGGVYSLAMQADGKILVAGGFTTIAGQTRNHIARLNVDGTLDTAFDLGANDDVYSLVVRPDGKILVGGIFTALGGQARKRIGQLNSDGTLDPTFNPGANNDVYSLALQADGKALVGGSFINLGGRPRYYIGRLDADGATDTNFNSRINGGSVYSMAVQADGKILAAGGFLTMDGQETPLKLFGRLNENGTLDTAFNPDADGGYVYCLAVQADGKILVGGQFSKLGGQTRNRIGRLNANGTLDTTFNPTVNNGVRSFGIQADGKILVAGPFTILEGQPRNGIGRLNQDGTLDVTFNPIPNGSVSSLAVQNYGKILVGGTFTTLAGQIRNRLGRLNATELATENLTFDGSAIMWLRGGSSPEVLRTTFDASTNGATWINLGIGTRIQGGWQLTNVFLPPFATIRARGIALGGYFNASSWLVESTLQVVPHSLFVVNDDSFGFLSNQFGFKISGTSGQTIILESSTNFSNWNPLVTNILGNGPVYFGDPDSTNFPQRFYRTRTSTP
jgi:uncharacterized delta-60 repeat protein